MDAAGKCCQELQAGSYPSPSIVLSQGATSQHPPGHPAQTLACRSRALLGCPCRRFTEGANAHRSPQHRREKQPRGKTILHGQNQLGALS